jgi:hypothetical protein
VAHGHEFEIGLHGALLIASNARLHAAHAASRSKHAVWTAWLAGVCGMRSAATSCAVTGLICLPPLKRLYPALLFQRAAGLRFV